MALDALSSAAPTLATWSLGVRTRATRPGGTDQASATVGAPAAQDSRTQVTGSGAQESPPSATGGTQESKARERGARGAGAPGAQNLTDEQRRDVDKLKARDAEVRAHEAAHMAAGGSHVRGGASYSYQQGPDGKAYAVGGEVSIDVSTVSNNPQATIQKMQQVRAAALAPAEPSGADRAVAAAASQIEAQARAQLAEAAAGRVVARYGAASAGAREPGSRINESA